MTPAQPPIWPLVLYFVSVIVLVTLMIGGSYLLGERHQDHETSLPYESGIASFGSARLRISARFYLVALFFVIFEIEMVFIFAWAVSLYDVGWNGYKEMFAFILILLTALAYLWQMGALDWSRQIQEPRRVNR